MALTISQGETLQISVQADAASTVTFYFAGASSQTINAAGAGNTFSIAADTTEWAPGDYKCEVRSVLAGITSVITRIALKLLPSFVSIAPGADIRTEAEKAVAYIESMLAGGAGLEARRYKINNRELERYSPAELLRLLAYWKRRVAKEHRQSAGQNGLGPKIAAYI